MSHYLENRVEITPKLMGLFGLLREKYTDYRVAKIIGIGQHTWYNMLRENNGYKTVDVSCYLKAKEHLLELGHSEDSLCQKLGVENLDGTFLPPKLPDYKEVAALSRYYISNNEISKSEFIRRLRKSDSYLGKIAYQTFICFLGLRNKTANPKMLLGIDSFLKKEKADELQEPEKPDYQEILNQAKDHVGKRGITITDLARELLKYDSSLGKTTDHICRVLRGRKGFTNSRKLRIIGQYLKENENEFTWVTTDYTQALYSILSAINPKAPSLYKIASKLKIHIRSKKNHPKELVEGLEKKVVSAYKRKKRFPLDEQILLNLFGKNLCRTFDDFTSTFSGLSSFLYGEHRPNKEEFIDDYLSSVMSDQSFLQVARNYKINTERFEFLTEAREELEKSKKGSVPYEKKTARCKLDFTLEFLKDEIKFKIMKRIFPGYWPPKRKEKMIIPGYQKEGFPS